MCSTFLINSSQGTFPPVFLGAIDVASVFTARLFRLVPLGCLLNRNFYVDFLLVASLPTISALVILCYWGVGVMRLRRRAADAAAFVRHRRKCLGHAFFAMFFLYSTVCTTTFRVFACEDTGMLEDPWRLRADLGISCSAPDRWKWVALAWLSVLVHAIGACKIALFTCLRTFDRARVARVQATRSASFS